MCQEVMKMKKMGRPKLSKEEAKTYNFVCRFDPGLHDRLLEYCERHDKKRSEVIRQGVMEILRKEQAMD